MDRTRWRTSQTLALLALLGIACAGPIVPQRTRPGGSARWAEALAMDRAGRWAADAALCRVSGAGIGTDGWLPDRGGTWQLDYWSPSKPTVLEVTVDSEGAVRSRESSTSPYRGHPLPPDWSDSPAVWAATRSHQRSEPVHTLDATLAAGGDAEHPAGQATWNIRFFRTDNTYETHTVGADGRWLTMK